MEILGEGGGGEVVIYSSKYTGRGNVCDWELSQCVSQLNVPVNPCLAPEDDWMQRRVIRCIRCESKWLYE